MFLHGKTRFPLVNSHCIKPDWPAPANVVALTTLRTGGFSAVPWNSLNLACHVGDDPAAVLANRRVLAGMLPGGSVLHWLDQAHGANVVQAPWGDSEPEADASWSRTAGQACVVMTADCLPVLFCCRAGTAVAATHAGWRGLLAGVLESTIAALGVKPGELLAWMGPAIGPAAFEVGEEVRDSFLAAALPAVRDSTDGCFLPSSANPGHFFADLYALARLRLHSAGLGQVFGGNFCTVTDADRFFSYRRDGQTGRMASVIVLDPGQART